MRNKAKPKTKAKVKTKLTQYTKVGKINIKIAKSAKIKSANVYITPNNFKHIQNEHGLQIEHVGFSVYDYIEIVLKKFNQIRRGTGDSYLLIVFDEKTSHAAAIQLNLSTEDNFWEVKTAMPMRTSGVIKKPLVWQKNAPPE